MVCEFGTLQHTMQADNYPELTATHAGLRAHFLNMTASALSRSHKLLPEDVFRIFNDPLYLQLQLLTLAADSVSILQLSQRTAVRMQGSALRNAAFLTYNIKNDTTGSKECSGMWGHSSGGPGEAGWEVS